MAKNIENRFQGKVMTFKDFRRELDRLKDYRDKALYCLMWCGFKEDLDNFGDYTRTDLTEKNGKYFLKGVEIEKFAYDIFVNATIESTYHAITNKQDNDVEALIECNYILKETVRYKKRCKTDTWNGFGMGKQSIRNRFGALKRYLGFDFSLSSIALSGMVRRGVMATTTKEELIDYFTSCNVEPTVSKELYKRYIKAIPILVRDDYSIFENRDVLAEYRMADTRKSEIAFLKEEIDQKEREKNKSENTRKVRVS